MLRRPRGDDGAMAVFVSLVMVLVLLPLSGLATSAYVRSGVQAEHVRATDSGALAGAASLVLLDVAELATNPFNQVSTDGTAFAIASAACEEAASVDNGLSKDYAKRLSCTARFSPDTSLGSCVGGLLDTVEAISPVELPTSTPPVPGGGVVGGVIGPVIGGGGIIDDGGLVEDLLGGVSLDLRDMTSKLTPALLHNGVRVEMRYTVKGPLDGLIGNDTSTHTAVSTARRRFKPILPADLDVGGLLASLDPDKQLQGLLYTTLGQTLNTLESVVGEGITELDGVVPPQVSDPASNLPAGCRAAVLEVIEDLRDALKPSTEEQDLLACLGAYVMDLDVFEPLARDPRCVRKLFRAQLAPNA